MLLVGFPLICGLISWLLSCPVGVPIGSGVVSLTGGRLGRVSSLRLKFLLLGGCFVAGTVVDARPTEWTCEAFLEPHAEATYVENMPSGASEFHQSVSVFVVEPANAALVKFLEYFDAGLYVLVEDILFQVPFVLAVPFTVKIFTITVEAVHQPDVEYDRVDAQMIVHVGGPGLREEVLEADEERK